MIPEYLDSACDVHDLCAKPKCPEAVKQNAQTGRWYITIGHVGFNTHANNSIGYASKRSAYQTIQELLGKGHHCYGEK